MIIPIITGLMNTIRGGIINIPLNKQLNAALFGTLCAFITHNWQYSTFMALAMLLGQAPAIFSNRKLINDKRPQKADLALWVKIVFMRGVVWNIGFFVLTALFYGHLAWFWLIPALTMPLAYIWCWKTFEGKYFNYWTLNEFQYGFLLGMPLYLLGFYV